MDYFDLHCDTLTEAFRTGQTLQSNRLHIDPLRGGRNGRYAQLFAVFVPDNMPQAERWPYTEKLLRLIGEKYSLVRTAEQLRQAVVGPGIAVMTAIENGGAVGEDLFLLETCALLGVKYITITWNGSNAWGCGSLSGREDGLTETGKQALHRMETLGILPDVSHLNKQGFWDVMRLAGGPVLATHTASRGVHEHPRNLTDEQIKAVADTGGLIGLTLYPVHLGGSGYEQAERHLERLLRRAGERRVAFGADFDGFPAGQGYDGADVIQGFYRYLCRKGYEPELLKRIFFGNCYDFFTGV